MALPLNGSIGALTFSPGIRSAGFAAGPRIVPFTRAGYNGRGYEYLGEGAGDGAYTAVLYGTAANAKATMAALAAMKGSTVSIVTELGTTISNFTILGVGAPPADDGPDSR